MTGGVFVSLPLRPRMPRFMRARSRDKCAPLQRAAGREACEGRGGGGGV